MPPTNPALTAKRHTLAHLLAAAVIELYPDAKPTIGPAIDNGFYYDFEFAKPIVEADLKDIEKRMRKILPSWKTIDGKEVSEKEARGLFKGNPYKLELIDEMRPEESRRPGDEGSRVPSSNRPERGCALGRRTGLRSGSGHGAFVRHVRASVMAGTAGSAPVGPPPSTCRACRVSLPWSSPRWSRCSRRRASPARPTSG